MDDLRAELAGEAGFVVSEADTAERWGSGLVPVLATPGLVALMERAAVQALAGHLGSGQTSVGTRIDIHHLAATPVGKYVRARAVLREVKGRSLLFNIEAWDETERIGEATHERGVVDTERFISRASAK